MVDAALDVGGTAGVLLLRDDAGADGSALIPHIVRRTLGDGNKVCVGGLCVFCEEKKGERGG